MATGVTLSKASASASKHEASAGARLRRFSQQSSSSGNSLPAPLADHPMTIANADLKLHNYCHWWVIDPRKVAFVAHWDLAMTLGLLYVALVTPVEVAFVKSPALDAKWSNPIFLINRLLDVMFIADMLLQFRLGYKQEDVNGTQWVISPSGIAKHYAKSFWFPLDGFSVLTSVFDLVEIEGGSSLLILKVLRTLRLLKLVKLARGSRVFKRWEMRLSINYQALSLFTILVVIILTCHWTACLWGIAAGFDPLKSWAGPHNTAYCVPWGGTERLGADAFSSEDAYPCPFELEDPRDGRVHVYTECTERKCRDNGDICTDGFACVDGFTMYVYALYFAIMTITSVGFGDVTASAFNVGEQICCAAIMFLTALLWGYLVGVFCTLAAAAPNVQAFRDELSQLNSFMSDHNLPSELRFRLREFLHETVHLRDAVARQHLLTKLSPAMQGEVALIVNRVWVSKVWYLRRDIQLELLIDLASNLKPQVFAPREFAPCGTMYICHKGGALYAGRPRHPGSSWGEDVLLPNPDLQLSFSAVAITYLWVFTIDAVRLHASLKKFPRAQQRLREVARMWTIRRAMVREAERRCFDQGLPFRNRTYPIYARELIPKIREMRLATTPNRHRRFGNSRGSSNNSTFTTNFGRQSRASARREELPDDASAAEIAAFRAKDISESCSFDRPLQRRKSGLGSSPPGAVISALFVKRLQHSLQRGSSLQVDPNGGSGRSRAASARGEGAASSSRRSHSKRRLNSTNTEDESAMRAAANFGLQLRQEQQVPESKGSFAFQALGDEGVGAGSVMTKALADDVQQIKESVLPKLFKEVGQVKDDMREMLTLLRDQATPRSAPS